MLKEARDEHRLAIRHRINVNFDPFEESIDAKWARRSNLADSLQLSRQILWRVGEVNREPADHI